MCQQHYTDGTRWPQANFKEQMHLRLASRTTHLNTNDKKKCGFVIISHCVIKSNCNLLYGNFAKNLLVTNAPYPWNKELCKSCQSNLAVCDWLTGVTVPLMIILMIHGLTDTVRGVLRKPTSQRLIINQPHLQLLAPVHKRSKIPFLPNTFYLFVSKTKTKTHMIN